MDFSNNLSIRAKSLIGAFFLLLILASFTFYLFISFNKFHDSLTKLDAESKKHELILALGASTKQLSYSVNSYILTRDSQWGVIYDKTSGDLDNQLTQIKPFLNNEKEKKYIADYQKVTTKIIGAQLLILEKAKEGDTVKAISLFDSAYKQQENEAEIYIANLVEDESGDYNQTLADTNNELNSTKNVIISIALFMLVSLLFIALSFSSSITKSLNKLTIVVNDISKGKLDTKIDQKTLESKTEIGELARAFDRTVISLKLAMREKNQSVSPESLEDTSKK